MKFRSTKIKMVKSIFSVVLSLLLVCLSADQIWSLCPKSDLISPCTCLGDAISCSGTTPIDIEAIFHKLGLSLTKEEKRFHSFNLNNTSVSHLKENTFKDIVFDEIHIHDCNNLTVINENAFVQTSLVTKKVSIFLNPKLTSPGNSIFRLLSKFVLAENILLSYGNITEIPDEAFKPVVGYQDNLHFVTIYGQSISKLGHRAFSSLRNIRSIEIGNTSIHTIPDGAFEFEESTNTTLYVQLKYNRLIDGSSFTNGSLSNIKRPVNIGFGFKDNNITYLDEKIFRLFLDSNQANHLDMQYQPLDCQDCRNVWLRNSTYHKRISQLKCSNGKLVDEAGNFEKCKDSDHHGNVEQSCNFNKNVDLIECKGNEKIDLKAYFRNLSDSLPDTKKHIYSFTLSNTAITTLDKNTFGDITFADIHIYACTNLTHIDENAFGANNLVTKEFYFEHNTKYTNISLFKILSKFVKAERIEIRNSGIQKIPSNAFEPIIGPPRLFQDRLDMLNFWESYALTELEPFAFQHLTNLRFLMFNGARLTKIPDNAFAFEKPSNYTLTIDVSYNQGLDTNAFTEKSLLNIKRPTEIRLGRFGGSVRKQFTFLNEKAFLPFLKENPKNRVDLEMEAFDCNDCRNYWIKKHDLLGQLSRTQCSNGKPLNDLSNFNCSW